MAYKPEDLWDIATLRKLFLEAEERAVEAERKYQSCSERALYLETLNQKLTDELATKK